MTPDPTSASLSVKFAMVRECRAIFGQEAAQQLWRRLGLPVPSEPPEPPGGGVRTAASLSNVVHLHRAA
ncbi:MAG: hypothetical protein AB7P02_23965 [Alphaproteobacteria bacterium]